jgi:rod shape-determining protein MreB
MARLPFTGLGVRDVAIDLGTANTLVYVRGRGIIVSEPSVVAIDQRSGDVHAVGSEAKLMIGRTPALDLCRPAAAPRGHRRLRDDRGDAALLPAPGLPAPDGPPAACHVRPVGRHRGREARGRRRVHVGRRREVQLIEEPLPAADRRRACRSPSRAATWSSTSAGGTTEVAVISLGGIVVSESVGRRLRARRRGHQLAARTATASPSAARPPEDLKVQLGSAFPAGRGARGRDPLAATWRRPAAQRAASPARRSARRSADTVQTIVDAVKETLERTPPELAPTSPSRGIVLAGGGVLLQGFAERITTRPGCRPSSPTRR